MPIPIWHLKAGNARAVRQRPRLKLGSRTLILSLAHIVTCTKEDSWGRQCHNPPGLCMIFRETYLMLLHIGQSRGARNFLGSFSKHSRVTTITGMSLIRASELPKASRRKAKVSTDSLHLPCSPRPTRSSGLPCGPTPHCCPMLVVQSRITRTSSRPTKTAKTTTNTVRVRRGLQIRALSQDRVDQGPGSTLAALKADLMPPGGRTWSRARGRCRLYVRAGFKERSPIAARTGSNGQGDLLTRVALRGATMFAESRGRRSWVRYLTLEWCCSSH